MCCLSGLVVVIGCWIRDGDMVVKGGCFFRCYGGDRQLL